MLGTLGQKRHAVAGPGQVRFCLDVSPIHVKIVECMHISGKTLIGNICRRKGGCGLVQDAAQPGLRGRGCIRLQHRAIHTTSSFQRAALPSATCSDSSLKLVYMCNYVNSTGCCECHPPLSLDFCCVPPCHCWTEVLPLRRLPSELHYFHPSKRHNN